LNIEKNVMKLFHEIIFEIFVELIEKLFNYIELMLRSDVIIIEWMLEFFHSLEVKTKCIPELLCLICSLLNDSKLINEYFNNDVIQLNDKLVKITLNLIQHNWHTIQKRFKWLKIK
jgi:hypothetical protein